MASGYNNPCSKNLNYDIEDHENSKFESSDYLDVRFDRKRRPKQFNWRNSKRLGMRMPNFEKNVPFYDSEFSEDYSEFNGRAETLDNIHWPELKSSARNKNMDKKLQISTKFVDASVQVDLNKFEQSTYPLWNTKEIVFSYEDDVSVCKQDRISRSTQIHETMIMKREELEFPRKPTKIVKSSHKFTRKNQSHKTYADVVIQHEGENYNQSLSCPPPESKTFLKLRDLKRKEIFPIKKDSTEGSSNDSEDETFTSLDTSLPEEIPPATSETQLDYFQTTNNDIPYREYGDGDSITNRLKKLCVENKENNSEYGKSYSSYSYETGEIKENAQNTKEETKKLNGSIYNFEVPYYNHELNTQEIKEKVDEIGANGFDLETALQIYYELCVKIKPRLPYTQNFRCQPDNAENAYTDRHLLGIYSDETLTNIECSEMLPIYKNCVDVENTFYYEFCHYPF